MLVIAFSKISGHYLPGKHFLWIYVHASIQCGFRISNFYWTSPPTILYCKTCTYVWFLYTCYF